MGAPQLGQTPLFIAAHQGKEALAQMLLRAGADKEAVDQVRARGLRGSEGGVVVAVISCISHGDWQITGTCLPQLLIQFPISSLP